MAAATKEDRELAGTGNGAGEHEEDDEAAREAIKGMNASPDAERTVEDLASEKEIEDETPPKPMQIPLPGTMETISSAVGGPKPTSSEARLLGGSLPIEGQYPLDDVVTLVVEAKVGAVEIVSTTDDWGNVTAVKRRHKMRMLSVRRA